MSEPVVTVWRNRIPYRCALTYWGRRWKFRSDTEYRRLIHLRRMHTWTAHAPINDGETLVIQLDGCKGWHNFECYQADGKPITITGPTEVPTND